MKSKAKTSAVPLELLLELGFLIYFGLKSKVTKWVVPMELLLGLTFQVFNDLLLKYFLNPQATELGKRKSQ
ncbi:hypothetical protein RCH18_000560 [Flavobacterium sp. PL11]|uniref:hypothetical protein n=1 Tax=Flavobacterium sp. PL11 TaxID=3071717 RepID=UPI002DFC622D|nr:hypothetical protein [Flavobacterium sp. PL11]